MPLPSSAIIAQAHALLSQGQRSQARAHLQKHLARVPGDLEAAKLLARVHQALSENSEAAAVLERTARIHRSDPHLFYLLGESLLFLKRLPQASEAFQASARLQPLEPLPHYGLAQCLLAEGDPVGAVSAAERCTQLTPQHPDAWFGLTTIHARLGDFSQAITSARRGLAFAPSDVSLLQAAIYALNVIDSADESELTDLHRRLGQAITPTAPRDPRTFPNARDPEKRLRLGLMSCDLKTHSVAFFLEGLLAAFDQGQFDVSLYSTTARHDDVTERLKSLATFRDLVPMTQAQIQQTFAADAPDILIDLSGWTNRAQMSFLAPRLAPLQGTYLGYANTTGLPSIDFRIVDALTDPPSADYDAQATERLIRLPRCFLAFTPSADWPSPRPTSGPRTQDSGPFTFASFNNLTKLSPTTARLWRRILDAVPNSRLLLKTPRVPKELLDHHRAALIAAGIPESRLTLHPYIYDLSEHIALYHQVDIALDPYPYHGTTTTCEALWMGVPVITLAGHNHRSRVGVSLLTTINHLELIAATEDDYVTKATQLAADPARLNHLHTTLRADMQSSELLNPAGLARAIEQALREEWRRYCTSR